MKSGGTCGLEGQFQAVQHKLVNHHRGRGRDKHPVIQLVPLTVVRRCV